MHPVPRRAAASARLESKQAGTLVTLTLDVIRRDGGTQGRITVDAQTVADYAALMLEGVEFPPVRAWCDGTNYWLSDGFQRLARGGTGGQEADRS